MRSHIPLLGLQCLSIPYLHVLLLCLLPWEIFHAFLSSADFFQNQLFLNNSFRNTIRVSNSLDSDHLGPNCLQRLSADDTKRLKSNSFLASGAFCLLLITFANSLDPDQSSSNCIYSLHKEGTL